MKGCKRCGLFIDNYSTYCSDCKIIIRREIQKKYRLKRLNRKKLGIKIKSNEIGNPKQDNEILKFLDKKRKEEDEKYNNLNLHYK